ncbi:acyl-CoA dehydrogenase family protein [Saccharothrix sp. HUAS TT1]|uniref:acyl-CoA dehydrogenase family protein n=1 Tax=unclassified Saccharothrix TaxID=2593673 RepID=UPI00345BD1F8
MEGEVVPHLDHWAADGSVDREFYQAAGRAGLLGPAVPEPYGGGGVDDFRYSVVITEESVSLRTTTREHLPLKIGEPACRPAHRTGSRDHDPRPQH